MRAGGFEASAERELRPALRALPRAGRRARIAVGPRRTWARARAARALRLAADLLGLAALSFLALDVVAVAFVAAAAAALGAAWLLPGPAVVIRVALWCGPLVVVTALTGRARYALATVPVALAVAAVTLGRARPTATTRGTTAGRRRRPAATAASGAEAEPDLVPGETLQTLGRLTGAIAHDFNNLLTAIIGLAEDLQDELRGRTASGLAREIEMTAHRGAALVDDLRTFARPSATRQAACDLNEGVRAHLRILDRLLGERVKLTVTLAPEPATVPLDANRLGQILLNLALNARDAMPDGGVLTIATRLVDGPPALAPPPSLASPPTLASLPSASASSSSSSRPGDPASPPPSAGLGPGPWRAAELVVSDSGVGIDQSTRRRIFEPYFSTKTAHHGSGLGLATVEAIVRRAGGTIDVDSVPGEGTSFRILLPRADDEGAAARADEIELTAEADAPIGWETVLIVEDDVRVRASSAATLHRLGYTVVEAADGEEAIELAAGHHRPFDLLLCDVVLPGLDGAELARRLRGDWPDLAVVFVSGYHDLAPPLVERDGTRVPGVLLPKPYGRAALAQAVRRALDARAAPSVPVVERSAP
jgi:signal transduction histidine kinase/ActR/RegA family two-component response regulator